MKYYIKCILEELGIGSSDSNRKTYQSITLSKKEVLSNHKSVISSFGITCTDKSNNLPSFYWLPKLHKFPFKHRFIAASSSCSTTELSQILTIILSKIKDGLQRYCEIVYSRSGINQMWILKNSKELLNSLKASSHVSSIKTYDFSTLYTTIPHDKLKLRLRDIITGTFVTKKGNQRYKYIVVKHNHAYFVKDESDAKQKFTHTDIIQMLNFLIDNIYIEFGGIIFQQTIGIPMGTNCAPLLADLFLYSYESDFIKRIKRNGAKKTCSSFNFTFRYIDDVLSLNNPRFGDYLDSIYPEELEIKDTTDTPKYSNYLDLRLEINDENKLSTKLYDKRDDFNFPIVNFPFICSNIPTSPAYGVFVSQLVRYARACTMYKDFIERSSRLGSRLQRQGYLLPRLKAALKKFYGRHHDVIDRFNVSVSQMTSDMFYV